MWILQYRATFDTNVIKVIGIYLFIFFYRNPLTEKILEEELKIDKIGYRNRIINKLKDGKLKI
jgi:hypothetical protein